MRVRGVLFKSDDFDEFEFAETVPLHKLKQFNIDEGVLCGYSLLCTIPITVSYLKVDEFAQLHVNYIETLPEESKARSATFKFQLICRDLDIRTLQSHHYFEDGLNEIKNNFPPGVFFRACINCRYSDYEPGGGGTFGSMFCFRGNKEAYLQVKTKSDLFKILSTRSEFVQETHLCPEFDKRFPNQFYRG